MKKTLYLECYSGISGDMTVAALLDLGADRDGLISVLDSLGVSGYEIKISTVKKSGIDCCDFDVVLDEDNHDHDMNYLHGSEHIHTHHHSHHQLRGYYDVKRIIDSTTMSDNAKRIANDIFLIIAKAESKAHNQPLENVHFHEVGAIDSIIDVISIAYCVDNLGITDVVVPYLCEGTGTVRCQHGILPIPVPAVANIAEDCGITLKIIDVAGELVTPTGAATVGALRTSSTLPNAFDIVKIGLGAGKREYNTAGFLRAIIIDPKEV